MSKYKCFLVFNRKNFNQPWSPICYSALIESLETVGFHCEILFDEQLGSRVDTIEKKDVVFFVDTFLLSLTSKEAHSIIESLEKEKNLQNSIETYQELLKLNNIIEKKFQKNVKEIKEETKKKINNIVTKKNEK